MSRKHDRREAFRIVFQMEFFGDFAAEEAARRYFDNYEGDSNGRIVIDTAFVIREVAGVYDRKAEIDRLVGGVSDGWELNRLSKSDLAIMRLAVYEIAFSNGEVPPGVAINEAVELAKEFSEDEAPSFINGILGKIYETLPKDGADNDIIIT